MKNTPRLIHSLLITESELAQLRAVNTTLSALHAAFLGSHQGALSQAAHAGRMAFRNNASAEGIDALYKLHMQAAASNWGVLMDLRADILHGGNTVFVTKAQPLLKVILARANAGLSEQLTAVKGQESEWKARGLHLHTGEIQPSEERLRLEAFGKKLALIDNKISKLDTNQFPPPIENILGELGLSLEAGETFDVADTSEAVPTAGA